MINPKIGAAVAAALGVAGLGATGLAQAAAPTLAQCVGFEAGINPAPPGGATVALYVSGSSAAQTGMAYAMGNDVFGGVTNLTIIKANGANKINFQAFCGISNGTVAEFGGAGTQVLIYYRAEGGSVSGLLPILADGNGTATGRAPNSGQINQLQLSGINQGAAVQSAGPQGETVFTIQAADITGTSVAQGPTDAFGGAVQLKWSDIGVTDEEPGVFGPGNGVTTGVNYPTPYNATIYGSMTVAEITAVGKTRGFQQAFGLYVNNGIGATGPVILAQSTALGLVTHTFSDWATVPNQATPGSAATAAATPVVWIDREVGSGSRAAFGIYFLGYGCGGSAKIPDSNPANDGWATSVVLAAVATTAGGITYASIDNAAPAGATKVALGEATLPTNLDSASNVYPFWFESWFVQNSKASTHNQDGHGTGAAVWTDITSNGRFVLEHSAPHSGQVNSIPNIGGTVTKNPVNALLTKDTIGTASIFNAAWTRGGNSCSAPVQATH